MRQTSEAADMKEKAKTPLSPIKKRIGSQRGESLVPSKMGGGWEQTVAVLTHPVILAIHRQEAAAQIGQTKGNRCLGEQIAQRSPRPRQVSH